MRVIGVVSLWFSRDDDVNRVRRGLDQVRSQEVGLRLEFLATVCQPLSHDIDPAADRARHPSRHSASLAQPSRTADQGMRAGLLTRSSEGFFACYVA